MHVDTSENSDQDMNMQMDEGDAEHGADMRSGDDTAGMQDTTHDSARDTVPRVLWVPGQPLPTSHAEIADFHDSARLQFHLRDQLLPHIASPRAGATQTIPDAVGDIALLNKTETDRVPCGS